MLKLLSDSNKNENDLLALSLDDIARIGAKKLLLHALDLEVAEYIERCKNCVDEKGKKQVVRNGKSKNRKVTTGAGTIDVKTPRVNDKREGKKFTSIILPPYLRKSKNVESILPLLYLKGLSGNAFRDALCGLLGEDAGGLSSSSIATLKKSWRQDLVDWQKQSIQDEFVYIWADGVNIKIRLGEDKKLCLLVLVGVNHKGEKKLLAVEGGYRESAENWKLIFNDLVRRGLNPPLAVIGDGGLGLWSAIEEIPEFLDVKEQRCWVHKIANILNVFPKRLQPKVKRKLHDMIHSERKSDAEIVKKEFIEDFGEKYPKATEKLEKNWIELTAFFDFPALHWQYLRTTNPIESTFATVKLRTRTTKGAGNKETAETMAFKLLQEAEKGWRKLKGYEKITGLLKGDVYKDGNLVNIEEVRGRLA